MANHPSDDVLLAMAGGATMPPAGEIAHLDDCPVCADRLTLYRLVRATLGEDARFAPTAATLARAKALLGCEQRASPVRQAAEVVASARRLVAEVVFDSWGVLAPGLSGVRGGLTARQLVWMSGDVEVDLQIAPAQPAGATWSLLGQVASPDALAPASVDLLDAGGTTTAHAEADPYGMFELAAPAGRYDLTVTLAGSVLVLPGLMVG